MQKQVLKKKKSAAWSKLPCPVSEHLGIKLKGMSLGKAVCSLLLQKKHTNPLGSVHGGILCDLADMAMGYAFLSHFPTSRKGVATNLQISFMKAVRPGQKLIVHAQTASHGRSIFFMECKIKNAQGEIVAQASSTCKLLAKAKK